MTISIEISGSNQIRRFRHFKHMCRGKERRVGVSAASLALLRFESVRVNRIYVASMESDNAAAGSGISAYEIRHAILIEIGGG
jgi:hypothetical protein